MVANREIIARYNIFLAVKAMYNMSKEKFFAMDHRYPNKVEIIDKYGYDPKQLHHLLRLLDFMPRYLNGEPYEQCLKPLNSDFLKSVKRGKVDLESARALAKNAVAILSDIVKDYTKDSIYNTSNETVDELLDAVQYRIIKKNFQKELEADNECNV